MPRTKVKRRTEARRTERQRRGSLSDLAVEAVTLGLSANVVEFLSLSGRFKNGRTSVQSAILTHHIQRRTSTPSIGVVYSFKVCFTSGRRQGRRLLVADGQELQNKSTVRKPRDKGSSFKKSLYNVNFLALKLSRPPSIAQGEVNCRLQLHQFGRKLVRCVGKIRVL